MKGRIIGAKGDPNQDFSICSVFENLCVFDIAVRMYFELADKFAEGFSTLRFS